MKNSKKYWTFWLILAGSLAGLVLLYATFRYIKQKKQENQIPDDDDEFVPKEPSAAEIIERYKNIKDVFSEYPENTINLITAQAMHETGDFTSYIYVNNKNMFGMKQPIARETLSSGEVDGYASFWNYEDSAKDQKLYFEGRLMPKEFESDDAFVKWLKDKSYFTDSYLNYKNGVVAAKKRLLNIINN